ncbi:MAG: 16S rRNA (uracil(1498)-N(3))-methyltransferase [Clostridia bacterium]|nr:16S rRNA (uracil(1498)-N(3))-methyltransferase [Clostridia bacterium]
MPRFFKEDFETNPFLEGADASHIARSLRMRVGEALTVCDSKGTDYNCVISAVSSDRISLEVKEVKPCESEPDIKVTLCTCLLKGDKFETVIRHSVELGVGEIKPIISANCVSRPDAKSLKSKGERWQKIANEAAGQCGRGVLPTVLQPSELSDFVASFTDFDLVLFFYEVEGEPLGETLWDNDKAKKIAVITGPEGGFTAKEAEMLTAAGAKTISLGKRILRAETAPLAALTGIMLLTDNLE